MKEQIQQTEERLRDVYNGYEAPFDQSGFDKFTAALDEDDSSQPYPIKLIILGLLALGLSLVVYFNVSGERRDSILSDDTAPAYGLQTTIDETPDVSNDIASGVLTDDSPLSTAKDNQNVTDIKSNSQQLKEKWSSLATNTVGVTNSTSKANTSRTTKTQAKTNVFTRLNTRQFGSEYIQTKKSTGYSSLEDNITMKSPSKNPINRSNSNEPNPPALNSMIEKRSSVSLLNLLPIKVSPLLGEEIGYSSRMKPIDSKVKYNRHFYGGLEFGYSRDHDFGSIDDIFKVANSFSTIVSPFVGYQLNENTAFELGYITKKISATRNYKDTYYGNARSVENQHLFNFRAVNTIPLFRSNWSLVNSAGYSFGYAKLKDRPTETSPNFEPLLIDPSIRAKDAFTFSNKNHHHLASIGAGLTYRISYNLDIGIRGRYTFGFNRLITVETAYLKGEGTMGTYEGNTKGNFGGVQLNLNYRLR